MVESHSYSKSVTIANLRQQLADMKMERNKASRLIGFHIPLINTALYRPDFYCATLSIQNVPCWHSRRFRSTEVLIISIFMSGHLPYLEAQIRAARSTSRRSSPNWNAIWAASDAMMTSTYEPEEEPGNNNYRQNSNTSPNLVANKTVDHSDVVGASPVCTATTTSSFST